MNTLEQLRQMLTDERPASWETLPDIELYMDQVLTYMQRQHISTRTDEQLTSAMINNYIKNGVLPRAKGKRYDRGHLAYLTAICALKQVLSVGDTGNLLKENISGNEIGSFYEKYRSILDSVLTDAAQKLDGSTGDGDLAETALRFALNAYVYKIACEQILDHLSAEKEKNAKEAKE